MASRKAAPKAQAAAGRGRPRAAGLRERILGAAKQVVLQHGISASLDRIAEAAGTTKVTLYSYFPSKEGLLQEALNRYFLAPFNLDSVALDPARPEQVLTALGRAYVEQASDDALVSWIASLYRSAREDPSLASSVYEGGPQRLLAALANYLATVPSLQVPSPMFAAEQFMSMVRGMEQSRALLGLPLRTPTQREEYLHSTVQCFLKAYRKQHP